MDFRIPGAKETLTASVEFGRVQVGGRDCAVAVVSDVTDFHSHQIAAFDHADFGIVRIDASEVPLVRYINHKGAEIVGRAKEDLQGRHVPLEEIFQDDETREILREQRQQRADGEATHYRLALTRPGSDVETPIEIFAVPDFDPSGEVFIGTTAIFQPTLKADVLRRIYEHIQSDVEDPHGLARKGIKDIGRVIPHDFAVVTLYHDGWAKAVHLEPQPDPDWLNNWFRLPPAVLDHMNRESDKIGSHDKPIGGLIVDDIMAMFDEMEDAEHLATDTVSKRLISEGHTKFLTLPLRDRSNWRASLTLFRRSDMPSFEHDDIWVLRNEIGGISFLQEMLHAFERKSERLTSDVRRQIGQAGNLAEASKALPAAITRHYKLQHVAFFRCDYADEHFELKDESGYGPHQIKLGEDFRQPFDDGLLGRSFKDERVITLNDLDDQSEDAARIVANDPNTKSCLTVPVFLGGLLLGDRISGRRPVGILHFQSISKQAFPPPVVDEIKAFVEAVEDTLYGLQRDALISTLQQESPSGLVLTDSAGTIWGINDTALRMLGLPADTEKPPRTLKDVFLSEEGLRIALQPLNIRKEAIILKHSTDAQVAALVDTADLPVRGSTATLREGLRLIQLTDLKALRWRHDVETVRAAVSTVTEEVQPYLVEAHGLIRAIRAGLTDDATDADAKFRRLSDAVSNVKITTQEVIRRMGNMPEEQAGILQQVTSTELVEVLRSSLARSSSRSRDNLTRDIVVPEKPVLVSTGQSELAFIFDTILDYIVSRKPLKEKLRVRVTSYDSLVEARLSARLGEVNLSASDSMTR
jgi:PAS domain-containing protein